MPAAADVVLDLSCVGPRFADGNAAVTGSGPRVHRGGFVGVVGPASGVPAP